MHVRKAQLHLDVKNVIFSCKFCKSQGNINAYSSVHHMNAKEIEKNVLYNVNINIKTLTVEYVDRKLDKNFSLNS